MVFESGRTQRISITGHSIGNWAACPTCHALIERGDRTRLARRSAKRLMKTIPEELRRSWSMSDCIAHVRRIHDDFWSNREGSPERIVKKS